MTIVKGCPKCNHTGLLPFIKPDGSVSKYAKVFCPECHDRDQHEYSYPVQQDDWDFPMSYDFRSYIEEQSASPPR